MDKHNNKAADSGFGHTLELADFTESHLADALQLVRDNYQEASTQHVEFPDQPVLPDLQRFAAFKLGVAALIEKRLVGFLCFFPPLEDAFMTTGVRGTFSPLHAHAAISQNRQVIYDKLYQSAALKLVQVGILSHAVALYWHDQDAIQSFFTNGFGLRGIDAFVRLHQNRRPSGWPARFANPAALRIQELGPDEATAITDQQNQLIAHLAKSPCFLYYPPLSEAQVRQKSQESQERVFTASQGKQQIAYIKIRSEGENYISNSHNMMNICGAYCQPEFRGGPVMLQLLDAIQAILSQEGYTHLGVDFESFNPAARHFWLKYFTAYSCYVVRRIDEKIIGHV